MFQALRARVGILGLARTPLHIQSRAQYMPATIQHVRFRRPGLQASRILVATCGVVSSIYLFNRMVLAPLDGLAANLEATLSEEEKKEVDAAADEPLFLPIPFTITKEHRQPYQGSSPEWQAFLKFAADKQAALDARDQLKAIVKGHVDSSIFGMKLGKNTKVGRTWLDVDYPSWAPSEYLQTGILIDDDGIHIAKQVIDPKLVAKLNSVLWPKCLLKSLYAFGKAGCMDILNTARQSVGLEPVIDTQLQMLVAQYAMMQKDIAMSRQQDTNASGQSASPPTDTFGKPIHSVKSERTTEEPLKRPSMAEILAMSPKERKERRMLEYERSLRSSRRNIMESWQNPMVSFWATYALNVKRLKFDIPRGSLIFHGMIEVEGDGAYLIIDVRAALDPKTREFDDKSMELKLRSLKVKKQRPLLP